MNWSVGRNKTLQKGQLSILQCISDFGGSTTNTAIRDKLSIVPQKLSYHIRELEKKALITTTRGSVRTEVVNGRKETRLDKRKLDVTLTNAGRLVLA